MRAAALAHAHGLELSSHLFPEFAAHLPAVSPAGHWLEYLDGSDAILKEPYEIRDGRRVIPDRPGTGFQWNEQAVGKYRIPA
jgi:mandelate racemase